MNLPVVIAFMQSTEAFWPVSVIGWLTFVAMCYAALHWLYIKLKNWGKDTDKWDKAATSLEEIQEKCNDLLREVRGFNGRGGVIQRLDRIENDVEELKERNSEADLFVRIYKEELMQRKEHGQPVRREADSLIEKLSPDETRNTEGYRYKHPDKEK